MKKRPKSREETPKEGSGNAERYRTATICGRVAQSARAFERFPMQKHMAHLLLEKPRFSFFDKEIQWVDSHLHTNEACSELSFQLNDRYLASIWLGMWSAWAAGIRIQNTRVQIEERCTREAN
ncbi:hypothetical protein [Bradyrhizobium sp. AZCC 2230]|uniref:hypothetical protein n=1 Tax=Bradyrhizobium sp. AZCC 2230 TaxID=3117021 RepID=UPI002FF1364D